MPRASLGDIMNRGSLEDRITNGNQLNKVRRAGKGRVRRGQGIAACVNLGA
jgi:hypothetical protein